MSEEAKRPPHLKLVSSREKPSPLPDHIFPLLRENQVIDWEDESWVDEEGNLHSSSRSITRDLLWFFKSRAPDGHRHWNGYRVFSVLKSFFTLLLSKTAQVVDKTARKVSSMVDNRGSNRDGR